MERHRECSGLGSCRNRGLVGRAALKSLALQALPRLFPLSDLFGITEAERMVLPAFRHDVAPRKPRVTPREKDLDRRVLEMAHTGIPRQLIKEELRVSDRTLQRVLKRHRGTSGH